MDKAEQGRNQLIALLGDVGARPADEVVAALTYRAVGVSPAADLATVIARPDDFRDRLLAEAALTPAEVAARADASPDDDHAYCLHTFALYLLALWHEGRAFRRVVDYLAADPSLADEQLDEILVEDMPAILARTYDGSDLGALKSLVELPDVPPNVRCAALRGLHAISTIGKLPRPAFIAFCRQLVDTLDPDANVDFMDVFALSLAETKDEGLKTIVDRWLLDDTVSSSLIAPADIEEAYTTPHDELNESLTRRERFDELVDYLSDWDWFQADDDVDGMPNAT